MCSIEFSATKKLNQSQLQTEVSNMEFKQRQNKEGLVVPYVCVEGNKSYTKHLLSLITVT